jgi:hypothetical protein
VLEACEPVLNSIVLFLVTRCGPKAMLFKEELGSDLPQLADLLLRFGGHNATDPRDYVFSLVGLSTARNNPRFLIDYHLNTQEVYISVFRYTLITTLKLDILCYQPRRENPFELPTWCPNWAMKSDRNFDSRTLVSYKRLKKGERPAFASRDRPARASISEDGKVLCAKGICLGKVVLKSRLVAQKDNFKQSLQAFMEWKELIELTQRDNVREAETFARTIFVDKITFTDQVTVWGICQGIEYVAEEFFCNDVADQEQHTLELQRQSRLVTQAIGLNYSRRFFVTEAGLVGLGPLDTVENDMVCILLGCCIPVILRQKGSHFIYVGDAYVDEYIDGLGIDELEDGACNLEDFEIH